MKKKATKTQSKKKPWQLILSEIRTERIKRVADYLDRLDEIIRSKKPPSREEIDTIKLALDVLGARKEEKLEKLDKLKEKEKKKKSASQVSSTALEKKMDKEAEAVLGKWRKNEKVA